MHRTLPRYSLPLLLFLFAVLAIRSYGEVSTPAETITAEYLRSPTPLTLQQAMADEHWQETTGSHLSFGFDPVYYWVRIKLSQYPLASAPGNWILESGYPLMDHMHFFLLQGDKVLDQEETGNNLPYAQRRIDVPGFAFRFSNSTPADHIYIAAHTESSVQFPLTVLPEADYWQQRVPTVAADAAFHAVLLSMLAYNFLIFLLTRDPLFLLYTASIGSIALMMATLHGWSYALLWSDSPRLNDMMVLLTIACSEVFTALFGIRFLRLKKLHSGMYKALLGTVIAAAVLGALSFVFSYAMMIRLLVGLAVFMTLTTLLLGVILWRETRSRDVFLFFLALSFLLSGLATYALMNFGLLPMTLITSHSAELGHVIQVILLALSLADRHNRERMARIAAQDVIISMQNEANAVLDQKVKERTEDLERANRRLQEESTTDALTQVRNRRYFDQRFFTLFQEAFRQQSPLALLLVDIDHFKQFNDNYGHQTGDLVLQQVASAMQKVVRRPMDSIYRYGGEEFAILLPITDEEGAMTVAEQLRKRVSSVRISHQGKELGLTVSVGVCAGVPLHREDQQELYEAADKALYTAKESGRNRVCSQPMPEHL